MNHKDLSEKLTAYALGELSPEETRQIESLLQTDQALQQELDAIRSTASSLQEHYQQDEELTLNDQQRDAIQQAVRPARNVIPLVLKWGLPLSAAALWLCFVFLPAGPKGPEQIVDIVSVEPEATELEVLSGEEMALLNNESKPITESVIGPSPVVRPPVEPAVDIDGTLLARVDEPIEVAFTETENFGWTDKKDNLAKHMVVDQESSPLVMKGLFAGRSASGRRTLLGQYGGKPSSIAPNSSPASARLGRSGMHATPQGQSRYYDDLDGKSTPSTYGPSLEHYEALRENDFKRVSDHPLSTFSIDVDTASYSNMRRFLTQGNRPPKDSIRIEELINYFNYQYAPPTNETPFAAHIESATCPWQPEHRLVRIGLKGKVIEQAERPAMNLVFLLDVSGSMQDVNKLPLVKKAMKALLNQLDERDRVAIVVYAGASGLVLDSTSAANKQAILEALDRLKAGGSTNGGAGIDLAYKTALSNFEEEGVNRVILCTDGDFNVGRIQTGDLVRDVETKAKDGIFLSVLGFGMGNFKDSTLEQLADKGNGNYAYIDTYNEARKVLVDQMTGTLVTIAKDVKIQVEFNPSQVAGYRLIGYVNRMLKKEDFNDDKKDAGEIGAGHTVTALYQVVPAGQQVKEAPGVDPLKYQASTESAAPAGSAEMLTVKLRYKQPDGDVSTKVEFPFMDDDQRFSEASEDFRFASSVAGLGMLIRESKHKGELSYTHVIEWASASQGKDPFGYRREFTTLVRNAESLDPSLQAK